MRALHRLAAGTFLNDDRGRDFVGVAGAFLPLGGTSLWYGHLSGSFRLFDELVRLALLLAQRVPARIRLGCGTVTRALVQIGTASRTESFAILAALDVHRNRE